MFRGSSVVEQSAVNRLVVGSNPTRGAIRSLLDNEQQPPPCQIAATIRLGAAMLDAIAEPDDIIYLFNLPPFPADFGPASGSTLTVELHANKEVLA